MRRQDRDHERSQRKSRYVKTLNDRQGREAREGFEDRWQASEDFSQRHFAPEPDRGFGQADRFDRSYAEAYREPWAERSGLGRGHGEESQQRGFYGKGPKNYKRSDERIKEEIFEALTWDNDLDATDIEVEVKDGEATLSGTVSDRRMKRLAEELIEDINGVKDVSNLLKIKKEGAASEKPASNKKSQRSSAGAGH